MSNSEDTYRTITRPSSEALLKDRGSKFYGFAFPVNREEEIKSHIEALKKEHHTARHWCYAWQLGENYDSYRYNDDGEPSNSAGAPIYGQIKAFDLTNILVVVVRYFGGTKLGVGGLIQAYKGAAQLALENADIEERKIKITYILRFDYPDMNRVMRQIKEHKLSIRSQEMELRCRLEIEVRKRDSERIYNLFESMHKVEIKRP